MSDAVAFFVGVVVGLLAQPLAKWWDQRTVEDVDAEEGCCYERPTTSAQEPRDKPVDVPVERLTTRGQPRPWKPGGHY